jgi:hypothetical protein
MIHGTLHRTRFKELGFTMSEPGRWRFVDITDAPDFDKDKMHEIGRDYPTKEQIMLDIERFAAEFGCDGTTRATPPESLIQSLAREHLGFETLDTRGRDSLDFREVSVWSVKAALEAAWKAGHTSRP